MATTCLQVQVVVFASLLCIGLQCPDVHRPTGIIESEFKIFKGVRDNEYNCVDEKIVNDGWGSTIFNLVFPFICEKEGFGQFAVDVAMFPIEVNLCSKLCIRPFFASKQTPAKFSLIRHALGNSWWRAESKQCRCSLRSRRCSIDPVAVLLDHQCKLNTFQSCGGKNLQPNPYWSLDGWHDRP